MIDGPVMLTRSGEYVQPLYPWEWTPRIDDIAHALSNLCRFTGHTSSFYSVAEHSCRVSDLLPDELQLAGLLHDAAEAYLGDMATPLKAHTHIGAGYSSLERALDERLEEVFGVDLADPRVKQADLILLATERRDLMPATMEEWKILRGVRPLEAPIFPWTPSQARVAFLSRFNLLTLAQAA